MQLRRNEIMTGLLVVGTLAVITFTLILLGAPGLFRPLATYKIYLDNAAGIKQGAPVMLAGRKIGQVQRLYSPVSKEEDRRAQEAADALHPLDPNAPPTPADGKPRFEVRVDVQVDKSALVYRDAKTRLMQLGLLGEMAIDITQGTETSGRARDGEMFAGERIPDFSEAAAKMLEVIKPVAAEATTTMKDLEQTAQNINHITDENSELNQALIQWVARDVLRMSTTFRSAAEFSVTGRKQDRVMNLLEALEADVYVSGPAATAYLDVNRFTREGIELVWKEYSGYPEYRQFHPPFVHEVTILDLLFHTGPDAPYYVWAGRAAGVGLASAPAS